MSKENDFKFRWIRTIIKKKVSKPYWTKEKLEAISTIATALEDYKYGYPTSFDGDKYRVININTCAVCGAYFEKYRIDGMRYAGMLCNKYPHCL